MGYQSVLDSFALNGKEDAGDGLHQVATDLDVLRQRLGIWQRRAGEMNKRFPDGAGIASCGGSLLL